MSQLLVLRLIQKISWVETGLVALVLVWQLWLQLRRIPPVRYYRRTIVSLLVFQMIGPLLYAGLLWKYFLGTPYARILLPPHSVFLVQKLTQGLTPFVAGWMATLGLGMLGWYFFLRRGHGAMFDSNDLALATIGSAAVGWPAVLIFLAAVFLMAVLGMLVLVMTKKKKLDDRLIVTPFILPSALLTLFLGSYPLAWTHLEKIRF